MEARYNVYFAGQLLEGQELAAVRSRMARLFNADETTLEKLFSGKTQLVKRDCDKATALKYKQAIEQAGARPVIKAVADTVAVEPAPAPRAMTAAEKIAALAAEADRDTGAESSPETSAAPKAEASPTTAEEADATDGSGITLAPAGTSVLQPGERQAPVTSQVQTPNLDVFDSGQRLSDVPPEAPAPPDTSHLSEAAVGELLPNLPETAATLSPDTAGIELAPDGTDLSDCAAPAAAPPDLDLSGMDLAPAGSDVLEARYRSSRAPAPPATDHLTLED